MVHHAKPIRPISFFLIWFLPYSRIFQGFHYDGGECSKVHVWRCTEKYLLYVKITIGRNDHIIQKTATGGSRQQLNTMVSQWWSAVWLEKTGKLEVKHQPPLILPYCYHIVPWECNQLVFNHQKIQLHTQALSARAQTLGERQHVLSYRISPLWHYLWYMYKKPI